jgi:hypothetical protein
MELVQLVIAIWGHKKIDMALMDVVISDEIFAGSRAIWDLQHINEIIVSKCHPSSIGFSAIVGVNKQINSNDDFGARLKINGGGNHFLAPFAAGKIVSVEAHKLEILPLDEGLKWEADHRGIIAVDGEREVPFAKGDQLTFKITRNGPLHVNVRRSLEIAQENGFFTYDIK